MANVCFGIGDRLKIHYQVHSLAEVSLYIGYKNIFPLSNLTYLTIYLSKPLHLFMANVCFGTGE